MSERALREAVEQLLPFAEETRDCLLSSECVLDEDGEPIRATMDDPEVIAAVEDAEGVIALAYRALGRLPPS